MATPTLSATMGESSRQATMVRVTAARNASRGRGPGPVRGPGQQDQRGVQRGPGQDQPGQQQRELSQDCW